MPTGIYPRLPVNVRFWAKVDKTDVNGCWLWTAGKGRTGYGTFHPTVGSPVYAHRYAYQMLRGPIPKGLEPDHLCRVRHCVNPEHLELVTHQVNILRGVGPTLTRARGATITHCVKGHPFSPANTRIHYGAHGKQRVCRTCDRAHCRAYSPRRKSRAKHHSPNLGEDGRSLTPEQWMQLPFRDSNQDGKSQ